MKSHVVCVRPACMLVPLCVGIWHWGPWQSARIFNELGNILWEPCGGNPRQPLFFFCWISSTAPLNIFQIITIISNLPKSFQINALSNKWHLMKLSLLTRVQPPHTSYRNSHRPDTLSFLPRKWNPFNLCDESAFLESTACLTSTYV